MNLICYNGAIIYECDTGKTVFRIGIPLDMIPGIFKTAADHNIHCHTYAADDIAGALEEDPCKVIAVELHDAEKLERFRKAIDSSIGDKVTTVYSNPYYLEIFMKEAGKGSAVKRLAGYLDIPIGNTYAAGDEKNDISMIEAAGCGIAMINASDDVKAYADVVTSLDNDHDGLEEFIRSAT